MHEMQAWEYTMVTTSQSGDDVQIVEPVGNGFAANKPLIQTLNQLGRDGWEVVEFLLEPQRTQVRYILKRPGLISFDTIRRLHSSSNAYS